MSQDNPTVGEFIKVWLPGETPWAECISVSNDGRWLGRINNKLIAERSNAERLDLARQWFPDAKTPMKKLHDYKFGDVVLWQRRENLWQPADEAVGSA